MLRAIAAVAGTVAGLVLLLSFKTHSATPVATAAVTATTTTTTARKTTTAAPKKTAATATTTARKAAATTSTVTGDTEYTQYGPVQVQVTVTNGKVTAVSATQYPSGDGRSQQINAYAIPQLNAEALRAGSAHISMISGASYTSDGYIASLQTALTKAGVA
jgi:uncharacterized protein with FMN-binding domain